MRKALLVSMGLIAVLVVLAFGIDSALAYSQYSVNKDATNCRACHGDFRSGSYTSLSDGQNWGNLHNLHRQTMLSSDCDACHGGSTFPVVLDSSAGGDGLNAISCMGCHGRMEDNTAANPDFGSLSGLGAGLRQHHYNAGQTICAGCHQDANPANYTPVGEDVLPDYYANPGNNHPNMPTDPCNLDGNENFAGIANGLDNDGDGFYDGNDTDCSAAAPDIAVSPPSINFGSITTGQSSSAQEVTISNNGTAALNVTDIALSGTDSSQFSLNTSGGTTPCGSTSPTIPAGNDCTVTVTFSPSTTGAKSASLDVDSDDPDTSTASATLSGTGVAPTEPNISVGPVSINFGSVQTGQSSSPSTVTISNTGNAALNVSDIALSGADSSEFSLNTSGGPNPCNSTSPTISAGNDCTVTVTFSPSTTGGKSASLDVDSDDPDTSTASVTLSGTGSATPVPDISVAPPSIDFGSVTEGTSSAPQSVTISNNGTGSLVVSDISLSGTNAAEFTLDENGGSTPCGSTSPTVIAGGNCTVTVTFSPTTTGGKSASLDVDSDDPDTSTASVSLAGTGTPPPAPDISVTPPSINFGSITEGASSSPQNVTINNNGTADLSVSGIALSGADNTEFSFDEGDGTGGTCGTTPITVAPSGNCTIAVTFSPLTAGGKSASLDITSDDPDTSTASATLSGTGSATPVPDISVAPPSIDFGSVTEGTSSAPQTVTISNNGTASLAVSDISLSGTNAAEFTLDENGGSTPCGSTSPTVIAGGNCTVTVTFSPTTTGGKSASLDIASDDPDTATASVSLAGSGLSGGANNSPSAPGLVSPSNGAENVDVPVTFWWNRSTDPDGDAVTYNLFVCDNPAFTGCDVPENPSPIASAMKTGGILAAGVGFMVLGMALGGSMSRRKKAALIIVLLAMAALLIVACSGDDDAPIVAPVGDYSFSVSGLAPGTHYYWKVVADDGMGGATESEVWSFTTR